MVIFKEPEVIAATIAAIAAIISLIFNFKLKRRTQRLANFLEVTRSSLEFKKQQLNEFYGPLYSLNIQNLKLANRLKDIKGEGFQLLDNLSKEILNSPDVGPIVNRILKNDEEIEKLLLTKSSLIESLQYPDSFALFLGHFGILRSAVNSALDGKVPPKIQPDDYYPENFDKDVEDHFTKIKNDIENILNSHSSLFKNVK